MPLPKDTRRQVADILKKALEANEPLEETLEKIRSAMGPDGLIPEAIARQLRRQKLQEVLRARESWFKALGWYFARLFMWGGIGAAAGAYVLFGARAADPLTWALLGAMGYYVLIQVCTPLRLKSEAGHLNGGDNTEQQKLLEIIKALETDADRS